MLIDNLFYRLKVQKAYDDYFHNHMQKNPSKPRAQPQQPATATDKPVEIRAMFGGGNSKQYYLFG